MGNSALVAHHYWGSPGGGQLVCASAASSFDKMGFNPVLTGTFKFDPGRYIDWYGIDISKYPVVTLPFGNIKAFGLWTRLFVWYPAAKAINKYRALLMFTDEETYKPLINYRGRGLNIIEYIHFPFEVIISPKFKGTGLAYGEDPYVTERYGKFPMNLYWGVFTRLLPRYIRENPFNDADVVLTNSKWTAGVAKMVYGEEPTVLNPPIAPNTEIVNEPRPFEERGNWVIMLGRFSEEKRYHWVVTELAPRLLREVKDTRIVIFGGATTRTQLNYMSRVMDLATKAGLRVSRDLNQDADLYLVPNAPRQTINNLMDSGKVFLHATINEHWGIAVAEAMARGLPTVVHKSGGTWSDLVEEGVRGLGYSDVDEAVDSTVKLLTDGKAWSHYSSASVSKAKDITLQVFISKFSEILQREDLL
ncbi:glycosyltransferase [Caldivirga sp.]|uniref:glycosyltransferase n=1 Tax=Caldivirga sp. TaxID=2080243 RepID=UPI003D0F4C2F